MHLQVLDDDAGGVLLPALTVNSQILKFIVANSAKHLLFMNSCGGRDALCIVFWLVFLV